MILDRKQALTAARFDARGRLVENVTTVGTDPNQDQEGHHIAPSLRELLTRFRSTHVDSKDRHGVSACFAPGHFEPEYDGPIQESQTFRTLEEYDYSLQACPQTRHLVVDTPSANVDTSNCSDVSCCTEDSLWLSLIKCQAYEKQANLLFCVVTVRSLERSFLRNALPKREGWEVEHGPRGSAWIYRNETALEEASVPQHETAEHDAPRRPLAIISDQPGIVARHGWEWANRGVTVVRILRCPPQSLLRPAIEHVVERERPFSLFDVWIRHRDDLMMNDASACGGVAEGFVHDDLNTLVSGVTLKQVLTATRPLKTNRPIQASVRQNMNKAPLVVNTTLAPCRSAIVTPSPDGQSFSSSLSTRTPKKRLSALCWACRRNKPWWAFGVVQLDAKVSRRCQECVKAGCLVAWPTRRASLPKRRTRQ